MKIQNVLRRLADIQEAMVFNGVSFDQHDVFREVASEIDAEENAQPDGEDVFTERLLQISEQCRGMLEAAGYGKDGNANTLWGMVRDACAEVKRLRERVAGIDRFPESTVNHVILSIQQRLLSDLQNANVLDRMILQMLTAAYPIKEPPQPETCEWTRVGDWSWHSACGSDYSNTTKSPALCWGCGLPVTVKARAAASTSRSPK